MQVLLHADPNTDGRHKMLEHLELVVRDALGRFGERITRVEAHLADAHSQSKPGVDDIQCTLEAHVVAMGRVVVKDHAGNAHQAIDGALRKLKRSVGDALAKHDPRQQRLAVDGLAADTTDGADDDAVV